MNDVRNGSPLVNVGSLEGDELRSLVKHLALPNDELVQRIDIHELVVRAILQILLRLLHSLELISRSRESQSSMLLLGLAELNISYGWLSLLVYI